MTLHVPITSFVELARSWGVKQAFVKKKGKELVVSGAHPTRERLLIANGSGEAEALMSDLRAAGLEVFQGSWNGVTEGSEGESLASGWPFIAAVGFVSSEEIPGVWVDAYKELPAQVTVLRRLYEDFRSTGELEEVAFEEFVRLAKPNVIIVTPADLADFVRVEPLGGQTDVSAS